MGQFLVLIGIAVIGVGTALNIFESKPKSKEDKSKKEEKKIEEKPKELPPKDPGEEAAGL